jgi:hypothetical protein
MPEKKGASTSNPGGSAAGQAGSGGATRKPWVKKTPVEVVLEQIAKQEESFAMRKLSFFIPMKERTGETHESEV